MEDWIAYGPHSEKHPALSGPISSDDLLSSASSSRPDVLPRSTSRRLANSITEQPIYSGALSTGPDNNPNQNDISMFDIILNSQ